MSRRSRAAFVSRARIVCAATMLTSALASHGALAAPGPTALGNGWTLYPHSITTSRDAVACADERAAMRTWHGDVHLFDGARWTTLPSPPDQNQGRCYGDGIAFHPSGGELCIEASGRVDCWDGKSWSAFELPGWQGPIGGLGFLGTGELVVVGRGRVGLRVGSTVPSHDAGTWRELRAVAGASLDELWTAGQGGTVMRRTRSGWERMQTGVGGWFTGLSVSGSKDAWAWGESVETSRTPVVVRWDGAGWRAAQQGLSALVLGIAGPADRPWAVTESSIVRFDGTLWAEELAAASLGEGYHRFEGICATKQFVLVAKGGRDGGAVVRRLAAP